MSSSESPGRRQVKCTTGFSRDSRETEEECGLIVEDLDKVGVILFEFKGQPQLMEVHVFRTEHYIGQPIETEGECLVSKSHKPLVTVPFFLEMCPQWFGHSDIPFDSMWPDDYEWYPHMLQGKYFDGYVLFEGHDRVLKSELTGLRDSPTP